MTLPLRDAVERALRGTVSWTVLVLHLSRLAPPAPRPHHRRIAQAVLSDAAARYQGQLFTLVNGDLVLLFPAEDDGVGLAATLGALFTADAPDPGLLLSRWVLPKRLPEMTAFLDALPTMTAGSGQSESDSGLGAAMALFNSIDPRRIRDLLVRQTGVLVTIGSDRQLLPVFREIRFSVPALEAKAATVGHVTTDPFLLRHLIAKLDPARLAAVTADLDQDGPMIAGVSGGGIGLNVSLTIEVVLSPEFDALVAAAKRARARVGIELALMEVFVDTDAFVAARKRIRDAGFGLVLDEVAHQVLLASRPDALGFDWLKLDWSQLMLQSGDALDLALKRVGPAKVILNKADSENAIRWGITRGVRVFQGRHPDVIMAASRLATCRSAAGCTLRQCVERESGATTVSRSGCINLPLLDMASRSRERETAA